MRARKLYDSRETNGLKEIDLFLSKVGCDAIIKVSIMAHQKCLDFDEMSEIINTKKDKNGVNGIKFIFFLNNRNL